MVDLDLLQLTSFEGLLPHRFPFLFVDRIVEFEPNNRIVGIKLVSAGERHLARSSSGAPVLPPTILMEAVAQVGALLVLATPAHHGRVPLLIGMDRIRFRRAVRAGDTVRIEVTVQKLRETMGRMAGRVRVGVETVATGVVTFALGPPNR